ncbi:MAG: glutamine--fructose-6-phosphate transaminase (isomerizing) [Methylophilales bacterium]|jgi:glutamine---fructose-6-phosphate transaminase (isomerizing)|nr:glutamine--fructose-6-phosphate transaminase (isomerizing) [Pseudomonadota bacterium]NQW34583.1 glutamine--fructose-6-phosphate transaminase (isomerizing) [Methylophilales bacterium]HCK04687.1 glutamine--fructose-6-phosphate transaminase (isomerizing) [Methylophilaceae bacterium]
MCGIVGGISYKNVLPSLIEGLERLEYRGYDSVGIVINNDSLERVRSIGRVSSIKNKIKKTKTKGLLGIGHTRWATHGGVNEQNAHPHISNNLIAVVHNGIIENHEAKFEQLKKLGYVFESETDTEVIAHLIHYFYQKHNNLLQAVNAATKELEGAYAIAVIALNQKEQFVCTRRGCPLLIGEGKGENFIASDVSALIPVTNKIIYLEDGDISVIKKDVIEIYSQSLKRVKRKTHQSKIELSSMELGPYQHYMQKEIYEQPRAISDTIEAVIDANEFNVEILGDQAKKILSDIDSVLILAAGTSYYAGLTAKYWFESIAKIPTNVEIASEYRYRSSIGNPKQLIITISQSGETLDTIEALKHAKKMGHKKTLTICNVQESAISRESKLSYFTRAGVEIGVASTKAFTTQLVSLFVLTIILGKEKKYISRKLEEQYLTELRTLVGSVQAALNLEPQIKEWSKEFSRKDNALFLGRGIHYPIALEGALKLKEISYIHAEAYPAGELKHGPLALVDEKMPVVVIAPNDKLLEKVKSNMHEVKARGGKLYVFADADSHFHEEKNIKVIRTPRHTGMLSPIVHAIPVQLLAYHVALRKKTDVDKPRNLAKSVTVE